MRINPRRVQQAATAARTAWNLAYLDVAASDAGFLNPDQYSHVIQLFDELATHADPRRSETLDVEPIDGFHELKDKGGILGKINLRVYYAVFEGDQHLILALGCYSKKKEGKTPPYIVTKMRNRLRQARKLLNEA